MKKWMFDAAAPGDGSVYAVGNGRVMAYGRGPEWFQAFGPVYTSPSALSLTLPENADFRCETQREPGTGIWIHQWQGGKIVDCAPRGIPCLARHFEVTDELQFAAHILPACVVRPVELLLPGAAFAVLIEIPAGTFAYGRYPTIEKTYVILAARGDVSWANMEGDFLLTLCGAGDILLIGCEKYADLFIAARRVISSPWMELYECALQEDQAFTARRLLRQARLRDHPMAKDVLDAADSVAMLIRAQQSCQGGVQAGYNYHMAYVRDQYGVARGLLSLGCYEEAEAILSYYADIFDRYGFIANAQSMGHSGLFHVHENDDSEITGYLVIQAFDMLRVTGNRPLFERLRPMIEWAIRAEVNLLHDGMLPFNGDETYVAGGLMPRTRLLRGSLEATMFLIAGGKMYFDWCRTENAYSGWMAECEVKMDDARRRLPENFLRDGQWISDSVRRLNGLALPDVRHGVCTKCGAFFGWTHRANENGNHYVCLNCLNENAPLTEPGDGMHVKSVILMQPYISADVLPADYVRDEVVSYIKTYRKTGVLPSLPEGNMCLGYDFGLLLYAAKKEGIPADDLLAHMLSILDDSGSWVEYYVDNRPSHTRCRPWESGIDIEGALYYLRK